MGIWENKKDKALQDLFRQLARAVDHGARAFEELLVSSGAVSRGTLNQKIIELEHQGDALVNQIRLALAKIAITSWIKQSDALQLSRLLDSILNGIRSASGLLEFYQIETIRIEAGEFANLIKQMSLQLGVLIDGLAEQRYHRNGDAIDSGVAEVGKLESLADDLRAKALKQVWQENREGILSTDLAFQWDKIIEALEEIADRAHHVATSVQTIITL